MPDFGANKAKGMQMVGPHQRNRDREDAEPQADERMQAVDLVR